MKINFNTPGCTILWERYKEYNFFDDCKVFVNVTIKEGGNTFED